jgi:protease YdgD
LALLGLAALAFPVPAAELPNWAVPLLPGVGKNDRRVVVDARLWPWRALGRVQTEMGRRCTGALVGPRTVLTAAHCLFLPRVRHFIAPESVHFVLGYERGRFAGHAVATRFLIGPGYDPLHADKTEGADWAVLTLSAPLGTPDRVLKLAPATAPGETVALAGYSLDRAEVIEADLRCTITAETADPEGRPMLTDDCEATRGVSGAPLLAHSAANGWEIAAIQVLALEGRAGGVAIPARVFRLMVSAVAEAAAPKAPTASAAAPSAGGPGEDRSR